MFMGLGQVLNETQESQIILSTLRERLWCSADQRTGGNLDKELAEPLSNIFGLRVLEREGSIRLHQMCLNFILSVPRMA